MRSSDVQTHDGGANWTIIPGGLLNVGVIDGTGPDGRRGFAFIGLPLHFLNGDATALKQLLQHIMIQDFGL